MSRDKSCSHRIFWGELMYFVKYFMHKVPNKCSPVDAVWSFFKVWDRETPLGSSLGRILTNKDARFLQEWVGVWVVLW